MKRHFYRVAASLFLLGNQGADHLQHAGHTARHRAVGQELACHTHSGHAIDLIGVLQLAGAGGFAADGKRAEHSREFGFVDALFGQPIGDLAFGIEFDALLVDGFEDLGR